MIEKASVYICTGTNLGDRIANLTFARNSLSERARLLKISSYYETEPVGFIDQPWFLNQVIELQTRLTPIELLSLCLEIEKSLGRVRTFQNAPRVLDLDILLYGDVILNQENLVLPHPRLTERKFVLEPLVEIAPDVIHPILQKPMHFLLQECKDPSEVRIFPNNP